MTPKETTKQFLNEAWPFLMWGLALMLFFHFVPFLGVKKELENIFFESAAIKTICALFSMVSLSAGLYLVVFSNKNPKGWFQSGMRKSVIAPAKFGVTFSAVGFGLFNGLALAALFTGDVSTCIKVFLLSLYLVLMAALYWAVANTLSDGKVAPYLSGYERRIGLLLIVAAPIMAISVNNSV